MNLAILSPELLKKIKTSVFTIDDIGIYISDIINHLGINKYLKEVMLLNSNDTNILAKYDFNNRIMKIHYDNIITEAIELYDNESNDFILFINMCIIECLIHEIVHVYQNYAINEFDYPLFHIYEQEINLFKELTEEEYNEYYNCFIFEREAIITAYETILIILKRIVNNSSLLNYYLNELSKVLKSGYEINEKITTSPIEKVYKNLLNIDAPIVNGLNQYDSLKLGTQVGKKTVERNNKYVKRLIIKRNNLNK